MQTTVKYYGVNLKIDYMIEGKFYPATHESEAEYPEIEVKSICAEDSEIDLQNILDWRDIKVITDLIEV